jgi:hypothetical protein
MKPARLAAGIAITMTLATSLAAAKPATVVADVNLRKAPGTDSEVVTLIPKGTTVEVGTCTNGWCMVSYNGMDGYSIAPNLGLAPRPVRRPAGGPDDYPPPPGYVAGGPVYYDPPPVYVGPYYYRPYYGYGWRGGWGWRHRW